MNGLTVCDWRIILAAYTYELGLGEVMSDASYERESASARARDTLIPGFLSYTGSWVGELDQELLGRVYREAMKVNMGKDDLHGPAIKHALDVCGIMYQCCLTFNCWE